MRVVCCCIGAGAVTGGAEVPEMAGVAESSAFLTVQFSAGWSGRKDSPALVFAGCVQAGGSGFFGVCAWIDVTPRKMPGKISRNARSARV